MPKTVIVFSVNNRRIDQPLDRKQRIVIVSFWAAGVDQTATVAEEYRPVTAAPGSVGDNSLSDAYSC